MGRFEGLTSVLQSRRSLATLIVVASALSFSSIAMAATHKAKTTSPSTEPSARVATGGCQPTADQASIGIRALQTELMVAGLKCSAEQWNIFTSKFKTTIKNDADRMQKLFAKAYGKGGPNEMNAFVTQLANDASQRSNGFTEADYCQQESVLFEKVLALTGLELERFSASRDLAVPAPVALCKAEPETPTTLADSITPTGSITPVAAH